MNHGKQIGNDTIYEEYAIYPSLSTIRVHMEHNFIRNLSNVN